MICSDNVHEFLGKMQYQNKVKGSIITLEVNIC